MTAPEQRPSLSDQYEKQMFLNGYKALGALNFSLSKISDPLLNAQIRARVARYILEGKTPDIASLVSGTRLE